MQTLIRRTSMFARLRALGLLAGLAPADGALTAARPDVAAAGHADC